MSLIFSCVPPEDVLQDLTNKSRSPADDKKLSFDIIRLENVMLHNGKFVTSKPTKSILGGVEFYRLFSDAILTGALIVSKEGARKLLKLVEKDIEPVDEILFSKSSKIRRKLKIYQTQEALAWQIERLKKDYSSFVPSVIEGERKKRKDEPTLIRLVKKYIFIIERLMVSQRLVIKIKESDEEKTKINDSLSRFFQEDKKP